MVIGSWENNWSKLSTYFKYPAGIRKLIYTTNTIEGYHRQIRKVTKNKGVFTSDMDGPAQIDLPGYRPYTAKVEHATS